jgi:tetratricopeptide (TPR) repeat protein
LSLIESADITRLRATSEYLLARDDGTSYAAAAAVCLESAKVSRNRTALARALLEFGRSGVEGGEVGRVTEALRQLDDLPPDERGAGLPNVSYAQAYCYFHLGRIKEASDALRRALEVLQGARNPVQESRVLTGLVSCHLLACETRSALTIAQQALELARRVGDESRSSLLLGNIAAIHLLLGHYDDSLVFGAKSIELARNGVVQPFLLSTYLTLMFASTLLDRRREAEGWFEEANKWVRAGRSWRLRLLFLIEVAEWELARGNLGTALNFFRAAQTEADQRSDLIPLETHYHVIEMLWISHARSEKDALSYIAER